MTVQGYLQEHTLDEAFLKKKFAVIFEKDKITIPVYDIKGKLLYCRYRHLSGAAKFSSDVGSHPALFAAHKVRKHKRIIFCEGEPDCMRLWQEGIPAVTGTAGVNTFSIKIAKSLKGKEVAIVLDNDAAGQSAIEHHYKVLEEVGAKPTIIILPQEHKDVCDYFTAGFTKEDFLKLSRLTLDDWYDFIMPEEHKFESAKDILDRRIPPEEWLVDRILPYEGFAFIFGAEATGKSFYTMTLANSVATGEPWLNAEDFEGQKLFQVKKKYKVLIIDKENTKRRIQSRMKGLKIDTKDIYWLRYPHYFELADPKEADGFSKIAKTAARQVKKLGIQLVIVDAFADVMIGNENAAGDVQKFFDSFRQLFPGCSILVVHHASKPAPGVIRTSAQRARGSTNLMAQIYSGFYVEAVHKSKTEFTLEQTKAGDAEKLNKFKIGLKVEPTPNQPGKTMVTALEYRGEVLDAEMKVAEAIGIIEEAFKIKVQISRKELVELLQTDGISQATTRRAIKQMTDENQIDSVPDPENKARRIIVWTGNGQEREIYEE